MPRRGRRRRTLQRLLQALRQPRPRLLHRSRRIRLHPPRPSRLPLRVAKRRRNLAVRRPPPHRRRQTLQPRVKLRPRNRKSGASAPDSASLARGAFRARRFPSLRSRQTTGSVANLSRPTSRASCMPSSFSRPHAAIAARRRLLLRSCTTCSARTWCSLRSPTSRLTR